MEGGSRPTVTRVLSRIFITDDTKMMKTVIILLVALTGLSHQIPIEEVVNEEVTKIEVTEIVEVVTTTTQPEIEITPFGECPAEDVDFPTYLSDQKNCSVFYQCAHGVPYRLECRWPLEFNPVLNVCDYPYQAGCLLRNEVNEVVEDVHEHVVDEAVQDAVEEVHQQVVENVVEDAHQQAVEDAVEEVHQQAVENAVEDAHEQTVVGAPEDSLFEVPEFVEESGVVGDVLGMVQDKVLDPILHHTQ